MEKQELKFNKDFQSSIDKSFERLSIDKEDALKDKEVLDCIKELRRIALNDDYEIQEKKLAKKILQKLLDTLIPKFKGIKPKPAYIYLLIDYRDVYQKLKNNLQRTYRNPELKKIHIREAFPELNDKELEKCKTMVNSEIALVILGKKYKRKPTVIRDWLHQARKEDDDVKKLKNLSASKKRLPNFPAF